MPASIDASAKVHPHSGTETPEVCLRRCSGVETTSAQLATARTCRLPIGLASGGIPHACVWRSVAHLERHELGLAERLGEVALFAVDEPRLGQHLGHRRAATGTLRSAAQREEGAGGGRGRAVSAAPQLQTDALAPEAASLSRRAHPPPIRRVARRRAAKARVHTFRGDGPRAARWRASCGAARAPYGQPKKNTRHRTP